MTERTYYVQFSSPVEDPRRWHTIACVHERSLAEEVARLAEGSYMRTTVTYHYAARVMSRSALKREGTLHHADWELGIGHFREYGEALLEKAARNLAARPD